MRRAWQRLADLIVRSSTTIGESVRRELPGALLAAPGISGQFEPAKARAANVWVTAPAYGTDEVPPPRLWRNGERDAAEYLEAGRRDTATMREVFESAGRPVESARTILDFGCATGRMTRWLTDLAPAREIWGVDVHGPSIAWCSEHLAPPFQFCQTTTLPHLPFADGSFDTIFAASVLDTMAELRDAWLLELRRLLAPDGALYITLLDRHSLETILELPDDHKHVDFRDVITHRDQDADFINSDWATVTITRGSGSAHAFYDLDEFRARWSSVFEIRAERQNAYAFETALVLSQR